MENISKTIMLLLRKKIYISFLFPLIFLLYGPKLLMADNLQEFDLEKIQEKTQDANDLKSQYLLGPGDELYVYFSGLPIFSSEYFIDSDGYLFLPEINYVYAKGKTKQELKREILKLYDQYLFKPDIDIFLINPRPITFFVSGEVRKPGLYTINIKNGETNSPNIKIPQLGDDTNFNRDSIKETYIKTPKLFNALKLADGVTNSADLSNIQIIRKNSSSQGGGKIYTKVDLLKLIQEGDQDQNLRIMDGDLIKVSKTTNSLKEQILAINQINLNPDYIVVYITGNVREKGITTVKKGSSLVQAIASTGGKKILTGDIEFIRFSNNGETKKIKFRYNSNAEPNSRKNPILMDGDIINVKRTIIGKATEVLGEISNPILSGYGIYSIFK